MVDEKKLKYPIEVTVSENQLAEESPGWEPYQPEEGGLPNIKLALDVDDEGKEYIAFYEWCDEHQNWVRITNSDVLTEEDEDFQAWREYILRKTISLYY
ncbi:MAG: hypothetical protein QXY07_02650 [Candidatus Bathyarchaeia archaeon]